jgi:hypothetical protein
MPLQSSKVEGRQEGREGQKRESDERENHSEREEGMKHKRRETTEEVTEKGKTKTSLWHLQFKAFRAFYEMTVAIKQIEW